MNGPDPGGAGVYLGVEREEQTGMKSNTTAGEEKKNKTV
jgi:hypothetical protein